MRYKLSRPISNKDVNKIVAREIKRQDLFVSKPSKTILKQILDVSKEIEERGLPASFVCKKLPGKLGRGVFLHPSAKPILRGQVIAPYSGVLTIVAQNDSEDSDYAFAPVVDMVLSKEEQQRLDQGCRYHPRRLYALDLDAAKTGNFTRFINHSDEPNIEARLIKIPANPFGLPQAAAEILYIAKKTIHPGEQLLVCYEDEEGCYWGVLGIKPFPINPRTFMIDENQKLIRSPT